MTSHIQPEDILNKAGTEAYHGHEDAYKAQTKTPQQPKESVEKWFLPVKLPLQWKGQFRKTIADLDDLGKEHNLQEPIKGDIYFDGIEIETFIDNVISQVREEAILEERRRLEEAVSNIDKDNPHSAYMGLSEVYIKKSKVLSLIHPQE